MRGSGAVLSTPAASDAPALVILDCDGVLFDSWKANVGFYDEILNKMGLPPLDAEGRELGHRLGTPQLLARLFAGRPVELARAEAIAKALDYGPFLRLMRPIDGLFDILAWLHQRYRTALATNRGRTIPELLSHFPIETYFDVVVGIHDVEHPKPAPDMLLHCLEHLAVPASHAIYVGDSPTDLAAAQAARIAFVGIGDAVPAEIRLASLGELPAWLSNRTKDHH